MYFVFCILYLCVQGVQGPQGPISGPCQYTPWLLTLRKLQKKTIADSFPVARSIGVDMLRLMALMLELCTTIVFFPWRLLSTEKDNFMNIQLNSVGSFRQDSEGPLVVRISPVLPTIEAGHMSKCNFFFFFMFLTSQIVYSLYLYIQHPKDTFFKLKTFKN